MDEGSIQRFFILLIVTLVTVIIQYLIIKVVIKDSIKKQILSGIFTIIIWYILSIYSIYKDYMNLFFFTSMVLIFVILINSIFVIKGKYYDSRKIKAKYKTIIVIISFVFIGLSMLNLINIYWILSIVTILLLLSYFIDYKNYYNYYKNNIK